MTRPRVDPSKRQRTAMACDSCKKRKQKCDGRSPCNTCTRRDIECVYLSNGIESQISSLSSEPAPKEVQQSPSWPSVGSSCSDRILVSENSPLESVTTPISYSTITSSPFGGHSQKKKSRFARGETANIELGLRANDRMEIDEKMENHTTTRMLQDGTGRFGCDENTLYSAYIAPIFKVKSGAFTVPSENENVYFGNAADVSLLQTVRVMIKTAVGQSIFTLDSERNCATEQTLDLPIQSKLSLRLPDKDNTMFLTECFFTHTCGLCQIFEERSFISKIQECYDDPLSVNRLWLSQIFLVLAVGSSFAGQRSGTQEAFILDQLREKKPDQSHIFFLSAKELDNPIDSLEGANLCTVQSLTCTALYMMSRSMQDSAYALCGIAIRSAYAIGLHQGNTSKMFSTDEQASRSRVWQSLFILDRLLGASLGRPTAIVEEQILDESPIDEASDPHLSNTGLKATLRSCHVIGLILAKVYRQGRISTNVAQELADECVQWSRLLPSSLHWRQASPLNPRRSNAIYHANMAYCRSIILLTRPFFLSLVSNELQRFYLQKAPAQINALQSTKIKSFSNACMSACSHAIALAWNAFSSEYLSPFSVFTTSCLFSAGLLILTQQFTWSSESKTADQSVANCIDILDKFSDLNPEAKRTSIILHQLRDVVRDQSRIRNTKASSQPELGPTIQGQRPSLNHSEEDSAHFQRTSMIHSISPTAVITPTRTSQSMPSHSSPFQKLNPTVNGPSLFVDEPFIALSELERTSLFLDSRYDPSALDEEIDLDALWPLPPDSEATSFAPPTVAPSIGATSVPMTHSWALQGDEGYQ